MNASRLAHRVLCPLAAAITVYALVVRPWHLRWGATEDEVRRPLPGDDLVATPMVAGTRAVSIARPPEKVWPWLVQQGYGRAGWYAYRIDNDWRSSPEHIVEAWQHLSVGDVLKTGENDGFTVTELEENRYWVGLIDGSLGRISVVQYLERTADHQTRLLVRFRAYFAPKISAWFFWLAFDVGDFLFMRKEMLGIKRRAEAS